MKLYRLRSNKFEELHRIGHDKKEFNYEETMHVMIEKNLSKVFPGVKLLARKYKIEDSIPDTIAFDTNTKSFVIIEYKNAKTHCIIDQGMSYSHLLDERKEIFISLYHKFISKSYNDGDINWVETRVIFISPSFTSRQKRANMVMPQIELYEIKQYDDNIISFNKLEWQADKSQKRNEQSKSILPLECTESDYLEGKYRAPSVSPEIRQIWSKLKDRILGLEKLEFKQMQTYAKFYSIDDDNSIIVICTIQATQDKINLTYTTNKKGLLPSSEFIEDATGVGKFGLGNYRSYITNEDDIEKAMELIKKVHSDKIPSQP